MKKKKEVPMPMLENEKMLAKKKVLYYGWVAVIIFVVGLFCFALWARKENKKETVEYVTKGVVTNYVCKIVGVEPEENMIAVECLTK